MKNRKLYITLLLPVLWMYSCTDDGAGEVEVDTIKPTIDLSIDGAFPAPCDTLYFGELFVVKALLSDNAELGSYSIDIHDNFDHHTHTTELEECDLDPVKSADNAFKFIQSYDIPEASLSYTTEQTLTIPEQDGLEKYDEGDYHFQIRVTDKEGWSSMKGYGVKILRR
jgi:hypothetical protein